MVYLIMSILISFSDLCSLFSMQSDKASMLDEAIEYLKSLQLQIQVIIRPFFPDVISFHSSYYI